ncbi:TPA: hypothetical protein HA278_04215 [Candidatus Woesearchaeota archaeon]|nr:hypothetical protein [Candidatus Woesearchaeota archaeon]
MHLYKEVGTITVNMALVETILMKELPVSSNGEMEMQCLLEISFPQRSIIVEPTDYDEFHRRALRL